MFRRYILFSVFFLSCFFAGGGLYYLCSQKPFAPEGKRCYPLWDDRLSDAEAILHDLPAHQQHFHMLCFQGFSLQKQKKFELAEKAFSQVANELEGKTFLFQEELLGGRILNGFFLEDLNSMGVFLSLLEQNSPLSAYIPLFKALYAYKQKNFSKVSGFLYSWKEQGRKASSSWLNVNLQTLFPESFLDHVLAHSLIETGQFAEGREILNRISERLLKREQEWDTKIYDFTMLLLSRSYFLELILSKSEHIYPDYYDMILFYLKKIHILEFCPYAQLLPEKELIPMIMEHLFVVPQHRRPSLMQILELWQRHYTKPKYKFVTQPLIETVSKNLEDAIWFCEELSSLNLDNLKQDLASSLGSWLSEKVKQTQTFEAKQSLLLLQILEPSISISEKLSLSSSELQDILKHDNELLKLRNYLDLWGAIQPYDIGRQQLIDHLVRGAKELWKEGGQDEKVLNLLYLVLQFANYDIDCENTVFLFVKHAYKQALTYHAISRLLKLDSFITETGITPVFIEEEEIANFFADAEYLFSLGEYSKSSLYCSWLSKVAPSPQVYRLLGLCLVEEKRYLEAWNSLQSLPSQERIYNSKVQKALALCQKHLSKDQILSYKG